MKIIISFFLCLLLNPLFSSAQETIFCNLSIQDEDSLSIDLRLKHLNVFDFTDSLVVHNDTIELFVCFLLFDAPSVTTYDKTYSIFLETGNYVFTYKTSTFPNCFQEPFIECFYQEISFPFDENIDVISSLITEHIEESDIVIGNISNGIFRLKVAYQSTEIYIVDLHGSMNKIDSSSGFIDLQDFPIGQYQIISKTKEKTVAQRILKI